jgi:hypothetical protein
MEIKRFDEFVNESHEFELDYDYDDLDEGLIDAIKGALTKPNYKDPKTAKDFAGMVNVVADRFSAAKIGTDNIAKAPVLIATKLINLLTMFLNKQGPFANRSGAAVGKPVPLIGKDGKPKAPVTGSKPTPTKPTPTKGGKFEDRKGPSKK